MKINRSLGDITFDVVNYTLLLLIASICIFPFIQIIGGSFATTQELVTKDIVIIPETFSLDAYKVMFADGKIPRSLLITVFITFFGTLINLAMTSTAAYALSRKGFKGRRFIMFLIVFTLLFEGGLIPTYLVVKELHMLNTYWSIMIPNAINAFNLILMRNFFMQLPEELFESAKMDGANELKIFYKIALPLSKASLATFALFYAVTHWNNFFHPFLYLSDSDMWPIQVWLRELIILSSGSFTNPGFAVDVPTQSLKMATIVVATVPILIVYPFVQKYFAKGVMVGSVKG
ncbi:carbohydrate ABC transporter permease [Radiobacillus sp. PE A8.2]|uniref:carbohydrate ABC transporter permease n=1 Tax=Radiobacillus sp. PE A8.2 TaxID=3380349 RepID=UPI00388EDC0B